MQDLTGGDLFTAIQHVAQTSVSRRARHACTHVVQRVISAQRELLQKTEAILERKQLLNAREDARGQSRNLSWLMASAILALGALAISFAPKKGGRSDVPSKKRDFLRRGRIHHLVDSARGYFQQAKLACKQLSYSLPGLSGMDGTNELGKVAAALEVGEVHAVDDEKPVPEQLPRKSVPKLRRKKEAKLKSKGNKGRPSVDSAGRPSVDSAGRPSVDSTDAAPCSSDKVDTAASSEGWVRVPTPPRSLSPAQQQEQEHADQHGARSTGFEAPHTT